MKIALLHDFLTQLGGAERVLCEFHKIFPSAAVYTLFHDPIKTLHRFDGWDVRTSFLQKFPHKINYKWYLPLLPLAVRSLDLSEYDLVLSDTSALIKGIKLSPKTTHICYCHTPTRYLWQERKNYVDNLPYPALVKAGVQPVLSLLKKWDYAAAQKVNYFIANSQEVRGRIKKFYQRDSEVIYPPVDTNFFTPSTATTREPFYLAAGRIEPYKRFDIAIDACQMLNIPLKIAGTGSIMQKLRKTASKNVEFLGLVSDDELRSLYRGAKAFLFPAKEDAGIMILESLACGTPAICFREGGAMEFVREGTDGEFFDFQDARSLAKALVRFQETKYDPDSLVNRARQFRQEIFRENILNFINTHANRI